MTTYWLSDFCSLFNSLNINPFIGDDKNFQFNSLTRLIIFITFVCAILFQDSSNQIFLGGAISIFLSVVIYMLTYNSSEMSTSFTAELKTHICPETIKKSLRGFSKTAEEIILEDKQKRLENEVTLNNYFSRDTKHIKAGVFLERDKTPQHVTKEPKEHNISFGPKVLYGTTKQIHSLIRKN
tara:strand:- start:84 stop:629 length:546 start_codon:yes stop_codon:yes gene_type:complete